MKSSYGIDTGECYFCTSFRNLCVLPCAAATAKAAEVDNSIERLMAQKAAFAFGMCSIEQPIIIFCDP